MTYIGVFLSSTLCAYLAQKISIKKNKGLVLFFSLLSILIPSILGGMRSVRIGTDITYYVLNNFQVALHASSFKEYLPLIYAKEPLYLFIVYSCAKLFGNINALLFVIECLTMSCVYIGGWKLRKQIPLPLFLLAYFFIYYNDSYNTVRQHLAMAIIVMGFADLYNKKYKRYLINVVVASLIHTSAIIGIIFILIHWYVCGPYEKRKKKKLKIREWILMISAFVLVVGIRFWCTILIKIGILSTRYLYYFNHSSVSNNTLDTLLYSFEVVLIFLFSTKARKNIFQYEFLKIIAVFNLIFLQLARFMNYGHRLSLYFGIINLLMLAQIDRISNKKNERHIIVFGMILVMAIYWIYVYCIGDMSQTFPYVSYFND